MQLVFIYGPPAAGKFTIARKVAEQTGLALFHNHLIVDAVGAVFPFGSEHFRALREKFWFETFEAAVKDGKSLIFTFLPENTVSPDFVDRVCDLVEANGGDILFVRLDLSRDAQLARLGNSDRGKFGKLRDETILKANFDQFEDSIAAMPSPALTIDTSTNSPEQSALKIAELLSR
ncbi:MAG: AAA family ATPase [Hyphomonadaceae bacterium]|nr:AAA family ATPase [Hyphomonadaceae bacterium]